MRLIAGKRDASLDEQIGTSDNTPPALFRRVFFPAACTAHLGRADVTDP
jgi:hypothetical protein